MLTSTTRRSETISSAWQETGRRWQPPCQWTSDKLIAKNPVLKNGLEEKDTKNKLQNMDVMER